MKNVSARTPSARRGVIWLLGVAIALAAAPAPAMAGRPTIFDLQNYLKQLPEKQRAREAFQAQPVADEEAPKESPARRR